MKIAVLGTGMVGSTIGSKLIELGHQVMMGSRTSNNEKAIVFLANHGSNAKIGTFAEAAAFGEIVFNCTAGSHSIDALKRAGEKNLNGKILIDVANPLDYSHGMPPTLTIDNTTSLGEEIQRMLPEVKVVKTLNTLWCKLMVNPGMLNGGDHDIFVCGDDDDAKRQVKVILTSFGWKEKNIVDLGHISKARGTEMYIALWLSIFSSSNDSLFNIKLIR
jgi:8-hydroxy-5-deazaflavin:NADPH oxidoreductase